jgi:hypothetical protein
MPLCHSRPMIDGDRFVPAALRMSGAAGIWAATGRNRFHGRAIVNVAVALAQNAHRSDVDSAVAAISLWVSNRPFRDGHHIGRSRFGIPLPSDDLSCRPYRDAVFENLSQEAKPMPSKSKITTAAPFRRNHSMDPAMKAGIGAIACSVLFLGFVLLAIHTLPVSIG